MGISLRFLIAAKSTFTIQSGLNRHSVPSETATVINILNEQENETTPCLVTADHVIETSMYDCSLLAQHAQILMVLWDITTGLAIRLRVSHPIVLNQVIEGGTL